MPTGLYVLPHPPGTEPFTLPLFCFGTIASAKKKKKKKAHLLEIETVPGVQFRPLSLMIESVILISS